jgi:AcrR family transcriptional regulator
MTDSPSRRRGYRSVRRQEQAEQTRDAILTAARSLFEARGYEATTIAAVAEEAGVSAESVYGHFGSKRTLLGELFRRAVRGGDERPVPEQRVPQALASTADQREQLRWFAADIVPRLERAAPLIAVLAGASRSDPELAGLLEKLHEDRRRNLRVLVEALIANGPLRAGPDEAVETLWALTGPEFHQMLRGTGGWSVRRYRDWLADSLVRLLLP